MMLRAILCLGALASTLSPAGAEEAAGCSQFKWSVAREAAAFAAPDVASVISGGSLPGPAAAVAVKLQPQAKVIFAAPPGRKPKTDPAYAAVLTLATIPTAGTYQVTLSDEAWIDVLQAGQEIRSSNFSGRPDCPGVRKSVKFPLQPGPATIQISGAAQDTIKLDLLPAE